MRLLIACVGFFVTGTLVAAPAGFVKTTIQFPLGAGPPAGLAFDPTGVLYALEGADFGHNSATLRTIMPNGEFGPSFPVVGKVSDNFWVGSMAYDPVGSRILISDNAPTEDSMDSGRLYAIDSAGTQSTIVSNIAYIAGVAVRNTGEIFISTAVGGSAGEVMQIVNGNAQPILSGLDFGAGLAIDANSDLIVQDANNAIRGRLQRLPISTSGGPLTLLENMQSSAGVIVAGNEYFTTGHGGLYRVAGTPLVETLFDSFDAEQWATAITFDPGSQPFEPFAGPNGGRLAYTANYGDLFITVLTPAEPGDYNGDGHADTLDYNVWRGAFGSDDPATDGNRDGRVDAADYVLWRNHVSTSMSSSAAIVLQTPEPLAVAQVTIIWLTSLRFRRCRPQ